MLNLKALIVDDEEPGRDNLEDMIHQYCPGIEVIAKAASAAEARKKMLEQKPDILFLDIEMPNENGIDLLGSLGDFFCYAIFVTAYEQYALEALKLSAIDYLLKPIGVKELQVAVQKAYARGKIHNMRLSDQQHTTHYLSLPGLAGYEIMHKDAIIRLEGDSNYTTVVTSTRNYLISKTLKDFEQLLDMNQFVRIHKAHIINMQHLVQVQHHDGGYALMADGSKIAISRRRHQEFMSRLAEFAPIVK